MYQHLKLLLLCLLTTSMMTAQDTADIHFSLNECISNFSGDNMDFSEFQSTSKLCSTLGISENGLYRRNPQVNKHSCTPGVNNTLAMCVEADQSCDYQADSDGAIRFEVMVRATEANPSGISRISFYQKAPMFFDWIDGASGLNNLPRRYGVRVTVDGNEVYRMEDLFTSTGWRERVFDFTSDPDFQVNQNTTFAFELTAYCPIGNGANASVWDIDELSIFGVGAPLANSGGTLTGGPFTYCVGDGAADNIPTDGITLSGNTGTNSQWVVTDADGNILGLPPTFSAVDFDGAGAGTCLVWHLSFENGLTGAAVGMNANDLQGCYSLSNPITVNRNIDGAVCESLCAVAGGTLAGGPFTYCVGDGAADNIPADGITLEGNSGTNAQWVVTDADGMILGLPPTFSAVDFDGAGAGTCLVWHLSFEDGLTGAEVGMNANDLHGCFSLSNPITVNRNQPAGGTLTGGPFTFDAVSDGTPDMIAADDITLTDNTGANSQWVITDDQGNILGLPPTFSAVDFDGAGVGTCLVWHLSFDGEISGAEMGMNANDITGCWSLSNSIEVVRSEAVVDTCAVASGTLAGGPFTYCVGDGASDNIPADGITLEGNSGTNSQWVVTDADGNILGLPPTFSAVDFDGAGAGTCLVWHLSFEDGLTGAEVGMNADALQGCFSLSNPITVNRNQPAGGTLTGGPFTFDAVNDGTPDMIAADDITLTDNTGANSQWVITDDQGNILGLPPTFSAVDFDGAGVGTCLVWHLSFDGEISGAEMGMNANDITGCWSLSNSIEVVRSEAVVDTCAVAGGTLAGGPFTYCVGDGAADNIPADGITLEGNSGTNSQWVVTDADGNILGLPPTFSAVDFDGAGAGTCLVWHLSFEDGLTGAEVGMNADALQGCFSLSNPITVNRNQPAGGTLTGGPFTFDAVNDGTPDMIAADDITLTDNTGANSQWVITDDQGNILGLPPTFSAVDFDGAGVGTCLVWHLSFDGEISGAEMGMNANDITGCWSLSNSIEVVRSEAVVDTCAVAGGTLAGGPFTYCVGDGAADNIPADGITLSGNSGTNSQWVVTDADGNILGLPPTFSAVDFDGAGAGTCLVWHLSFEDGLTGAEVGMNADALQGCFSLSNPITVNRNQPAGGTLTGGPFTFDAVNDGTPDMIAADDITLTDNTGANSQWVITDDQGNILGLPPTFSAVDFDGAGAGTCLVWHLSFDGEISGAEMGMNANDITGCWSLSNSIEVVRSEAVVDTCAVAGGTLAGGPFTYCVGDGAADNIPADGITLEGNSGTNSQWVVTDADGNILGLPPTFSAVDFDGAGAGTCLVWHLSFEDGLTGAEVGMNADALQGCFSLSNPITVNRNQPAGGTLTGGPFTFDAVNDGTPDMIAADDITLTDNTGANSQWVITDDQGNILGLPPTFSAVDFDGAGVGTCLVWHLSFDGEISGAEMGMNANDITGCWSLSNSIEVVRSEAVVDTCAVAGGTLAGGPFTYCVGDGAADNIPADGITLEGNAGTNSQWVVTDADGNILGLPPTFSAVDFDGAGAGTCLVWHLSFEDGLTGAEVGMNADALQGCFSLSNPITVNRNQPAGGTLTGGPFTFDAVNDGTPDMIAADDITLTDNTGANSQWVITDDQGNILGLPPTFSAVDFDGAGAGTCLVWHLSFDGEISGAEMGMNANDITGCWSLSNSIQVIRSEAADTCAVAGGTLTGGPFTFCVGDGEADNIPAEAITLEGNSGTNSQWVVTDADGMILGLPPTFSAVDFDGAGAGTCIVWHLSFEDGLMGAEMGMNADDLQGCFSLSNPITVIRNTEGEACSSGTTDGPAVVVVNEIIAGDRVELKNIGGEAIDISSYWLCDFPAYDRINNLTVECGNLILEPGATITVITDNISIDSSDGEMGLYTTNSFSSSAAILDYVEWGSTNHGRSNVAIDANIWTIGDFVPGFAGDKSLSYDGEGNESGDWAETDATACQENGFRSSLPATSLVSVETMQNPVLDQLVLKVSTSAELDRVTIDIRNIYGTMVKSTEMVISAEDQLHSINISDVSSGLYYVSVREAYGLIQSTIVKL